MTSTDYFQLGNTCGINKLSEIASGNYRSTTGEVDCANPWYPDYNNSYFGSNFFRCGTYLDFDYVGAVQLKIGAKITFRTGFNTFQSSTDMLRDAYGASSSLVATILDSAVTSYVFTALSLLFLTVIYF